MKEAAELAAGVERLARDFADLPQVADADPLWLLTASADLLERFACGGGDPAADSRLSWEVSARYRRLSERAEAGKTAPKSNVKKKPPESKRKHRSSHKHVAAKSKLDSGAAPAFATMPQAPHAEPPAPAIPAIEPPAAPVEFTPSFQSEAPPAEIALPEMEPVPDSIIELAAQPDREFEFGEVVAAEPAEEPAATALHPASEAPPAPRPEHAALRAALFDYRLRADDETALALAIAFEGARAGAAERGDAAGARFCERCGQVVWELAEKHATPPAKSFAELAAAIDRWTDPLQTDREAPEAPEAALAALENAIAGTDSAPAALEPDSPADSRLGDLSAAVSDELRAVFHGETQSLLARLASAAHELHPYSTPRQAVDVARDAAHTLHGAASAVRADDVARFAADLEELFERVGDRRLEYSDSVHAYFLDAVAALRDWSGEAPTPFDQHSWHERFLTLFEPPPPPPGSVAEIIQEWSRPDIAIDSADLPGESAAAIEGAFHDDGSPAQSSAVFLAARSSEGDAELDDRNAIAPELLEVFTEEAEDHLSRLHVGLAQLLERPADRALLQEVRRSAHTLKGAAGAVGLRTITRLSHRMEDLLDRMFDGGLSPTPAAIGLLQAATDALDDLASGGYDPAILSLTVAELYVRFAAALPGDEADPEPPEARRTAERALAGPEPLTLTDEPPALAPKESIGRLFAAQQASSENGEEPEGVEPAAPAATAEADRDAVEKRGQVVRVPLARLDDLVRLVSELVINRTAFEQRMSVFSRTVEDLRHSIGKLRTNAAELQTEYEAKLLGGDRGPAPTSNIAGEFDDLEFDRYTQFHLLARALAESSSDLATIGSELNALFGEFDTLLNRQGRLSRDIQNRLMRTRMVPLASLTARLERAVRMTAQSLGKSVRLDIEGEGTELDKTVLEEMADALVHLLRNCADHGVESVVERRRLGKPERATVRVKAYYQGTQVVIEVGDDGRGLDVEAIRAAAIRLGFLSPQHAADAVADELFPLIFAQGFTTAPTVSEISGRGVGMDVVRSTVHKLKGAIHVASAPSEGVTFTIRLPMTLAIVRALMVAAGGQNFAVPMQAVTQILRIEKKDVEQIGESFALRHQDKVYPLYRLAQELRLPHSRDLPEGAIPVLVANTGTREVAVQVERILSGREIVVKSLGAHLRRVQGVMGATLTGDGAVVPILNVTELFRHGAMGVGGRMPARPAARPKPQSLKVLIVDDSVSVRRVLSNLIKAQNWTAMTAKDGLDAMEQLQRMPAPPDLMLVDVEMPRLNGYELLAAVRGQGETRSVPVIMVTSRSGDKHRRKAMELGASGYVVKPYQEDELVILMRRLTGARARE